MQVTREQVVATLNAVRAVAECIRDVGEVPNGELYVRIMPSGMSFEMYCNIIDTLKRAGVVSESNNLLRWIGPRPCGSPFAPHV